MNKIEAVSITVVYSFLVIAALYAHPYICPKVKLLYYRPAAIIVMAIISYFLLFYYDVYDQFYWFNAPYLSKCSIFSTVVLFLGPALQYFFDVDIDFKNQNSIKKYLRRQWKNFTSFECFKTLAIGPFTEEMIYRCFGCLIWKKGGMSDLSTIFLLSFLFGLSHLNKYFIEKHHIGVYIVQVVYTTLFGWWEAFVWQKTHSYLTCVFIHTFCNYMQFPDFNEALHWENPVQKIFIGIGYLFGLIYFFFSIGLIQTTKI
ncbi:Clan U, family U48, CaaX prenyl peptidase 2-like protein [Tritrichomonas foetus]|uniref:intramembrane prenyl-peptidase Rce1 n=1 Tax=Tritrichomonas foetus TaxID=1144522 RepID=A0A1J4L687_9EUKA|nr:Clan U, family U48, CaaX prenyl peptidase 2-like protein [Tritrichomonas foetus]|eukprot:OHT17462.1 Clan U, family U48, CaaX prenyl peptidase 2-like protein [Tritrichomonas foetus]